MQAGFKHRTPSQRQCIYLQGNRQYSKRVKTVVTAQFHQRLSTHSKKFPILWLIPHKASTPLCVIEFSSQNPSIRKRQVRASYKGNKRLLGRDSFNQRWTKMISAARESLMYFSITSLSGLDNLYSRLVSTVALGNRLII